VTEKVVSLQGDTVDLLVWRVRGSVAGLVETVLGTNPGLAALGPVLPIGTVVVLPDAPSRPTPRPAVRLWD
jgi:phage tail protein X